MIRFKYTITYYDECNGNAECSCEKNICGYIIADNYIDAMTKMTKYYGDENIIQIHLLPETNDEVIEIFTEDNKKDNSNYNINWKGPALNTDWW